MTVEITNYFLNGYYDYLIVGSGLAGSIFAYEAKKRGKKVVIVEKRSHIGGNVYNEKKNGINIHSYGPHIMHCQDEKTWNYINKFASFNNYIHRIKAKVNNKLYSFPINLLTLHQVYGVKTPSEAKNLLNKIKIKNTPKNNLESWIVSQIGYKLYDMFFKNYTKKQWNKNPQELPAKIAKRIPIRTNFNDNYYNHKYQGIPKNGYNEIFEKMTKGIQIITNFDFNLIKNNWKKYAKKLIYTGAIDELFDYRFGILEYRTLRWEYETYEEDYQGCSVINYCDQNIPYTRIIEHKHFDPDNKNKITIISKEYPEPFLKGKERLYPVDDEENRKKYSMYESLKEKDIVFLGRLSQYRYFDMNQVISSVLTFCEKEFLL